MKKFIKPAITGIFSLVLILGIGFNVSAATGWNNFSTNLPQFSGNKIVRIKNKDNNSNARINTTYVGSDYKANMWLIDAQNSIKYTGTLTNMTDGSDRTLTVDDRAVGRGVALMADNATWSYVLVELSGRWQVDTR